MPEDQRTITIRRALENQDPTMLKALADVPAWDTSVVPYKHIRTMVADSIKTAEFNLLEPVEQIAIQNAEKLLDVTSRKMQAFSDEAKRIAGGLQ